MEITQESKMSGPVISTQIDRTSSVDSQSRTSIAEMDKIFRHYSITAQNVLLTSKIAQLEDENDSLNKNLACFKSENTKLEINLSKLDAVISEKHAILLKTQREIERLKDKEDKNLQNLASEKEKSENIEIKIRELNKRFNDLTAEHAALQNRAKLNEEINREEISLAYTTINEFMEKSHVNESCTYDELSELRSELQEELEFAKQNVIASFKSRLDDAESELFKAKRDLFDARSEKEVLECEIAKLKIEIDSLASNNNFSLLRIENMERDHSSRMRILQESYDNSQKQLEQTNEKLHNIMYDYEEIVGNHLALDTEINVYRKLLEGEEKRVGISSRKRNFFERENMYKFSTITRGKKMVVESVDSNKANFLKIFNESKKPTLLNSFKLRISSGNIDTDYKVPKSSIPAGDCFILYAREYQGVKEENSVVISDLNCFSASKQGDTKIGLLNSKDHIIWEIVLTPCVVPPSEASPIPKIFNKRKASMKCMNSPTLSPISILRRPSTPLEINKKVQSEQEQDRKPTCAIS
ncbi:hypothetical protein MXB_4319 [Myxobolus squamalis]|nr:hypothetical protein MXB_4319 [Myxobolus squamalis]